MQNGQTEQVDDQTSDSDPHHQSATNFRWITETMPGFVHDKKRHRDQRRPVHQSRQNFRPIVTERSLRTCRAISNPDGENAERQRGNVREHMTGISQQSQRVADEAADNLSDHVAGCQDQSQQQSLSIRG